ncbi:hypothetical protein ACIRD8_10825 [Streptomyces sp. NPDC102451]|uniref:ISAzo13-like element transposase-related protein n=1 Tax=Streptomyces sp. NPDC102451 TaxID=3366177 RepID=UPI0037F6E672
MDWPSVRASYDCPPCPARSGETGRPGAGTPARELSLQGHHIGHDTVVAPAQGGGLLLARHLAHTPRARHPDRDAQFRYITDQAGEFTQAGQPVIGTGSAPLSGMPPLPSPHSTTSFPPVRSQRPPPSNSTPLPDTPRHHAPSTNSRSSFLESSQAGSAGNTTTEPSLSRAISIATSAARLLTVMPSPSW